MNEKPDQCLEVGTHFILLKSSTFVDEHRRIVFSFNTNKAEEIMFGICMICNNNMNISMWLYFQNKYE